MTKQEQIEILERAIPLILTWDIHSGMCGICAAVSYAEGCSIIGFSLSDYGITLPPKQDEHSLFHWHCTPEGDEARRQFLRDHIERLKKELTTP